MQGKRQTLLHSSCSTTSGYPSGFRTQQCQHRGVGGCPTAKCRVSEQPLGFIFSTWKWADSWWFEQGEVLCDLGAHYKILMKEKEREFLYQGLKYPVQGEDN